LVKKLNGPKRERSLENAPLRIGVEKDLTEMFMELPGEEPKGE